MLNKTNHIIDYFSVIGIGQKLNSNDLQEKDDYILTDIEIVVGCLTEFNKDIIQNNEKWVDLEGTQTLWLKCTYDLEKPGITEVNFFYLRYEDDCIKIPDNLNFYPVPVQRGFNMQTYPKLVKHKDNMNYFKGNFDLTTLLERDQKTGFHLIMVYKIQSETNYDDPICRLRVLTAKKSKKDKVISGDFHLVVPQKYQVINFMFGKPVQNRMICYKKKVSILAQSYSPTIIDRYPLQNQPYAQFPEAISMFCFPQGVKFTRDDQLPQSFSFILTLQDGCRIYCSCLIFTEVISPEIQRQLSHIQISKENPLFYYKAICVTSHYPYLQEFKELLKHIYTLHLSKCDMPIERYICNIVDELRLPTDVSDWGKVAVIYDISNKSQIVFNTSKRYYLFSKEAIKVLFRVLDHEKIIFLFECVLLEKKIFLISKYKSIITLVAEALISLIFPFVWNHVLIPILPDLLKSYTDAPVPFIIGINLNTPNIYQPLQNDSIQANLDNNDLMNIETLPCLPEKSYKQLKKRLQIYEKLNYSQQQIKQFIENYDNAFQNSLMMGEDQFNEKFDVFDVRDAFFEFLCSIMANYKNFLIPPEKKKANNEMNEICNVKDFLSFHNSSKQGTFLSKFVETGMFSYFIETRTTITAQESYYQFFDQCLDKKRNKKEPLLFTEDIPSIFHTCNSPNNQNIKNGDVFKYTVFPQLKPENYIKTKLQNNDMIFARISSTFEDEKINLQAMDFITWTRYLLESIYSLWFSLFIKKLKIDFFQEHYIKLTDYAIFLLNDMIKKEMKPNEQIFRQVIEACGYYGKADHVLQLVQQMKALKIEVSPATHGIYFQARSNEYQAQFKQHLQKNLNTKNINEEKKSEDIESEGSEDEMPKVITGNSKIRFDQIKDNSESQYKFAFSFQDPCPNCKKIMHFEEIISGWKKSYHDYTTHCPNNNCNKEFIAKFTVIEMFANQNDQIKLFEFLPPLVLKKELDNLSKIKGDQPIFDQQFASNHALVYWNIQLYFMLIQGPSYFIECGMPLIFYTQQAIMMEKKQQELIRESEQGLIAKVTQYLFSKDSNSDKGAQKGSPQQSVGNGSPHSSFIQTNKIEINQNFAHKAIKKVFTPLYTNLKKECEKRIAEMEQLKIQQGNFTKNQDKESLPCDETMINPLPVVKNTKQK